MFDLLGSYGFATETAAIWVLAAYSLHILLRAGIFAIPQVGFMSIGAYTAAVLCTRYGLSIWLGILAAAFAAAVVAAALGFLLRNLSGIYLAIASIAFVQVVQILATNLQITGGALGITGIVPTVSEYAVLGCLAAVICLAVLLSRSWVGRAMDALREEELVAQHMGVSSATYRRLLFTASGAIAGLAGGMLAHLTGFLQPGQFGFSAIISIVAVVVVGGMSNAVGPLLGGLLVYALPEVLTPFGDYRDILNGVLLVVVILVAPGGLAAAVARILRTLASRCRPQAGSTRLHSSQAQSSSVRAHAAAAAEPRSGPAGLALVKPVETPAKAGSPALRLTSLTHRYGGVLALCEVSFDVRPGELLGLVGPNGSGKTTLLNCVSGAIRPTAGSVAIDGRDATPALGQPHLLARMGVSRTFQGIRLVSTMDAGENVEFGAYGRTRTTFVNELLPRFRARARAIRKDVADRFATAAAGELPRTGDPVTGLPYGTLRQLEIERSLVSRPALLLLDEPAAGMTPEERSDIFRRFRGLADSGMAVVVIEHDIGSLREHCDRIAVLNFGRLIALDSPENVVNDPNVIEAYLGRNA